MSLPSYDSSVSVTRIDPSLIPKHSYPHEFIEIDLVSPNKIYGLNDHLHGTLMVNPSRPTIGSIESIILIVEIIEQMQMFRYSNDGDRRCITMVNYKKLLLPENTPDIKLGSLYEIPFSIEIPYYKPSQACGENFESHLRLPPSLGEPIPVRIQYRLHALFTTNVMGKLNHHHAMHPFKFIPSYPIPDPTRLLSQSIPSQTHRVTIPRARRFGVVTSTSRHTVQTSLLSPIPPLRISIPYLLPISVVTSLKTPKISKIHVRLRMDTLFSPTRGFQTSPPLAHSVGAIPLTTSISLASFCPGDVTWKIEESPILTTEDSVNQYSTLLAIPITLPSNLPITFETCHIYRCYTLEIKIEGDKWKVSLNFPVSAVSPSSEVVFTDDSVSTNEKALFNDNRPEEGDGLPEYSLN